MAATNRKVAAVIHSMQRPTTTIDLSTPTCVERAGTEGSARARAPSSIHLDRGRGLTPTAWPVLALPRADRLHHLGRDGLPRSRRVRTQ